MEFVNRVDDEKGWCMHIRIKQEKIFVLQIQIMNHILLKLKGKMPRIF